MHVLPCRRIAQCTAIALNYSTKDIQNNVWQILGLRICMMPHTMPCQCALGMRVKQMLEISQSSRMTTVESNMKSEHNLYLACEDSTCFLLLHSFLFSSCPLSFYCTWTSLLSSFSMPPTVGCVQHSTPHNTYVAEDQLRCPTHPPLSRSAVLPRPPSLG